MKNFLKGALTRVRNFFIRQRTVTIVTTTAMLIATPAIGVSGLLSFIAKLAAFAAMVSFLDGIAATTQEKRDEELVNTIEGVAMTVASAWASIYIAPMTVFGAIVGAFICQIVVSEFALLFINRDETPRNIIRVN